MSDETREDLLAAWNDPPTVHTPPTTATAAQQVLTRTRSRCRSRCSTAPRLCAAAEMTDGPIEFLNDREPHTVPPSEMGGADGLVQPAPHELTPSERHNALIRAGATVDGIDPVTGLDADDLNA